MELLFATTVHVGLHLHDVSEVVQFYLFAVVFTLTPGDLGKFNFVVLLVLADFGSAV